MRYNVEFAYYGRVSVGNVNSKDEVKEAVEQMISRELWDIKKIGFAIQSVEEVTE